MSINRVNISGNLGTEPELRATSGGMAVLSFQVAVNDRVKQQDGTWTDRPNWVSCTMFGTRAEKLAQYLHKGSKVAIEGKLRWSQWEKDGQKRSKLEVIVDEIEFLSRGQEQPSVRQERPQQQTQQRNQVPDLYDEDIPFD